MEDEEEAYARALERSRLEHQQIQRASANPPDQRGQSSFSIRLSPINLVNRSTYAFIAENKLRNVPLLVLEMDYFQLILESLHDTIKLINAMLMNL